MSPYATITVVCLIVVLVIVLYGTLRCKITSFQDPLTFSLFPPPLNNYLDGWGLTHLFFFMSLAYSFPSLEYIAYCWVLGVIWELIEYSMKDHPFYMSRCNYKVTAENGKGWWYGRWQDIVTNTVGLIIGYTLAKNFKH